MEFEEIPFKESCCYILDMGFYLLKKKISILGFSFFFFILQV